jgi:hypothetical protein
MTDGPHPSAPDPGAPTLVALIPALVADSAELKARMAAVERATTDYAARTEARLGTLEAQIDRQGAHLVQQDQQAERVRLEIKSQLGTLQQQLGTLQATEQKREEQATLAEQRAEQRHQQSVTRLRQTVAAVAVFVASQVWTLLAGWPLRWRMGALGLGAALVLCWAILDYLRARPQHRRP